jgi:SAM-dependent methyltransferase
MPGAWNPLSPESRWYVPSRRIYLSRIPAPTDPDPAARYFLPPAYVSRSAPSYYADEQDSGVEYQPGVYRRAARIGKRANATTIVDVGCGQARKLVKLHPRFRLIGVDFGENIQRCRQRFDFGDWIDHDLEQDAPLPVPDDALAKSIVVCADVIEHLVRPDRLLAALRRASDVAPALLLSTPDRDRLTQEDQAGPPTNESHVREWSRDEFATLLRHQGFSDGYITYSRSQTGSPELATLLYVRRRLTRERRW